MPMHRPSTFKKNLHKPSIGIARSSQASALDHAPNQAIGNNTQNYCNKNNSNGQKTYLSLQ